VYVTSAEFDWRKMERQCEQCTDEKVLVINELVAFAFYRRKHQFKAVCKRFGLPRALLSQYNTMWWNSWYDCAVAICAKLDAIKMFLSEECKHHATDKLTTCRMDMLYTYYNNLSTSADPSDFGIQFLLQSIQGLEEDSITLAVRLCQQICLSTAESVQYYIGRQPSWKFFEDVRVFDPRMICGSVVSRDIAQYKAILWLVMDVNNSVLLEEWSIYVAQNEADLCQYTNIDSDSAEHFDISCYWNDRRAALPCLAAHALRALDIPVSSADAERAFSSYNKLVCFSKQSLSDKSVRALHSAAWNGDITGRFRGYE